MPVFGFPTSVNEKAARAVAGQVVAATLATLALGTWADQRFLWLAAPLALGFALRVAAGPRLSPFGLLATRVIAPRLGAAKTVPGAPKRFAQAMGLGMTVGASVLVAFGQSGWAQVLLVALAGAASLEAFAGLCLGCKIFALGMRIGLIPEAACVECADISLRPRAEAARA